MSDARSEVKKVYVKEVLDYEIGCRPTRLPVASAEDLHPGDHIHWYHHGSWRDGIVHKIEHQNQAQASIHMIRYGHILWRGMMINDEKWQINFAKDYVYRYEYGEYCHPPSVVITRAKVCQGLGNYNALRNNNDDFCRWCKSGKHTYLCKDETIDAVHIRDGSQQKDGTYTTDIYDFETVAEGTHLCWKRYKILEEDEDPAADEDGCNVDPAADEDGCDRDPVADKDGWRHGIVTENEDKTNIQVVGFHDESHTLGFIPLTQKDFNIFMMKEVTYEQCHMLTEAKERALSQKQKQSAALASSKLFSKWCMWCKTGLPSDAEVEQVPLKVPKGKAAKTPEERIQDILTGGTWKSPGAESVKKHEKREDSSLKAEFGKGGARSAGTATARAAAFAGLKQASKAVAIGAAAGATAAGLEAVILTVEVTITYKKFNNKQMSKDNLLESIITKTVKALGSAGGAVGGGAIGAAIGMVGGPIGIFVGGVIGGIVGGVGGHVGGHFGGQGIAYLSKRPYEYVFVDVDVDVLAQC